MPKLNWNARSPPHFDLVSKNIKSEVRKMLYNKAREERKWKKWKEGEEKLMRELGMCEDSIQELRRSDWEDFKAERLYKNHWGDYPKYFKGNGIENEELIVTDVKGLLDIVSDKKLFNILKETDEETLQIIIFKMIGFSVNEIAKKMGVPEQTIYTRMSRLKKKIIKFVESE